MPDDTFPATLIGLDNIICLHLKHLHNPFFLLQGNGDLIRLCEACELLEGPKHLEEVESSHNLLFLKQALRVDIVSNASREHGGILAQVHKILPDIAGEGEVDVESKHLEQGWVLGVVGFALVLLFKHQQQIQDALPPIKIRVDDCDLFSRIHL